MAILTANDVTVIEATIFMPLYGVWSADLVLDQPDGTGFSAGTQVQLICDGGLTFAGTVVPSRTGDFLDAVHVRILAGAAGMTNATKARGYVAPGITVQSVLEDLASDAGEQLSDKIAQAFLGQSLSAWTTFAGQISQGLLGVLEQLAPTFNWRFLPDGTLWTGAETWDSSSDDYDLIRYSPSDHSYELAVDAFTIVPGVNLQGIGQINRLEHQLTRTQLRTHAWLEIDNEERGPAGSIQALAQQIVAPIDFYALYDARVISQSSDGKTVDLQPNDARLPQLSAVPLRLGAPATVVKFAPGTTLRLGWDSGSPQLPFAGLFQGGETLTSYVIGSNADAFVTKKDLQFLLTCLTNAGVTAGPSPGGLLAAPLLSALAAGGWSEDPGDMQLGSAVASVQRI
jgi:hypothetical protein